MKFYRYEETRYDSYTIVHESHYRLVKETPCGYWISAFHQPPKWISKTSRKRFAYPTKAEARVSFKARKKRQIEILSDQINNIKNALAYFNRHFEENS